jgi:hypothetical protein
MWAQLCDSPAFFGLFVVSGLFGAIGTFVIFLILVKLVGSTYQTMDQEWFFTGVLTGIFERFFFTTALGLLSSTGSGLLTAMIGWIAVKGQVHYKMFSEAGKSDMKPVYLGLLGSLTSLLMAVFGGYLWSAGYTLRHLLAP